MKTTSEPAHPVDPLQIKLLGVFQVLRAGRMIPDRAWRSQNTKGLLAYLALKEMARREDLMRNFWPDQPHQTARANLCSTLRYVRLALRSPQEPDGAVVYSSGMYRFQPRGGYILDVEQFQSWMARAREASDHAQTVGFYRSAVSLYSGDFLEGFAYDWVAPTRERLRRHYLEARLALASDCFQQDKYHECLEHCCHILGCDTASEAAHQLLIRTYLKLGQREAAVRQCQQLRQTFAVTLKAPLSPESRALCQTLLY
jgi:DNA-binding SARP family transcriptional activator